MNVLYEEEGDYKVGAVLADHTATLQVEAPHGKRSKVKASAVVLRFETPSLAGFMTEAGRIAGAIDIDFLWQCCGSDEFSYDALAHEYFGHAPTPIEAAGVALKLHEAPMYFYKKGRGRYKAAPEDALKAALASVERKRREAETRQRYVARLMELQLPEEFAPLLKQLLYRPDKASVQWKALDEACGALKLTPARLFEKCGALPSSHDYHLERFLFEYFPRGTEFGPATTVVVAEGLPDASVSAFSIDDATTTEIDDAFSVVVREEGGWRVGVHIAAPALGVAPGSALDHMARERLSTVYYPGAKITMLPEEAIACYTLAEQRRCTVLSLYLEVTRDLEVTAVSTRIERVEIAANLRHDALERAFNDEGVAAGNVDHPFGAELHLLWRLASRLEGERRGETRDADQRPEYSFTVENDRVTIVPRRRGTPIDKVVSELMIFTNRQWGGQLAAAGACAIFRVQTNGKVRMSTVAGAHDGLGVEQYVWATSPLRRYVDLINQRQLVALARGEPPLYRPGDEALLAAMRDFEVTYEAYADFQRAMERYWCLRWLTQEGRSTVTGSVIRDNLVRFAEVPLVVRVPSLPVLTPGTEVDLAVEDIDFLELALRCDYRGLHGAATP